MLRNTINPNYDAWYAIHDSDALGRELEKAIKGRLFDRGGEQPHPLPPVWMGPVLRGRPAAYGLVPSPSRATAPPPS